MKRLQRYAALHPLALASLALCGLALALAACASQPATAPTAAPLPTPTSTTPPTVTPAPPPTPVLATRLTPAERAAVFDTVWQTVNDGYFDPTFGGQDWQAIGDAYRQKLATVQDDLGFWFGVVNPMLFELGVSHLAALPSELASEFSPMALATGWLGLDVRLLDGKAVITRVSGGSSADEAGLRPGYELVSVDGWTLGDLAAVAWQAPPDNERNRRGSTVDRLRGLLYGEIGTEAVVEYRDASDESRRLTLPFAERGACESFDPSLPAGCAEFEARRLANSIGYVRFSAFVEPVLDRTLQAIDDFRDAPALIIDLRGNAGGLFYVRHAIASQLVGEPKLFMRYQLRDRLEEAYLDPVPGAYQGEVVILVDELSISSAEEFAGSLQALGRATIVGSQTPGKCLVANVVPLPNDAILMYPHGQSQTPDGRVLENNGVVPDIAVALDRSQLLEGTDAQLQAAIEFIMAVLE
jgi:carboxyl-terminal processing protease